MAHLQGYSIWLDLAAPAKTLLSGVIEHLSARYKTPSFEPHITLTSQIPFPRDEVLSKARDLSAQLAPCEISFETWQSGASYFKAFYLAAPEPRAWLMRARASAVKVFAAGAAETRDYDPHLSLVYGEHLTCDEQAVASLLRFPVKIGIDGLSVVKTEGAVPEWQREARYPLEGS